MEFSNSTDYREIYKTILETTIDAAEIIVQCSKHMKTIVDGTALANTRIKLAYIDWHTVDVLTMSKLDSGLFVMTPVDVQLESIARDAVKMFEGEARSAGIKLKFCVEPSCKQFNVANVSLDPTRVLQILIVGFLHNLELLYDWHNRIWLPTRLNSLVSNRYAILRSASESLKTNHPTLLEDN
jgi:hypothetical protein